MPYPRRYLIILYFTMFVTLMAWTYLLETKGTGTPACIHGPLLRFQYSLSAILASTDTEESEGRQINQC